MMGALAYLVATSWKNRLVMRIRRLRQPKYLMGAVVGGCYFLYICFSRYIFSHAYGRHGQPGGGGPVDVVFRESVGSLILFAMMLLAWILPQDRGALVFSEAEVAFLFPAPVSRRTLIHFKLIKSQIAILLTSALFTLIFGWSRGGGSAWTRAIGWWVIFSTLNLHQIASSFARTILMDHGITTWKRRAIVLGFVMAAAAGIAVWAWRTLPPPPVMQEGTRMDDLRYYAELVLRSGPFIWLLYPFRIVVAPYLAPDTTAFLVALGPALLLLAMHYVWVVRSNVAFEEASVEASRRMAEKISAMRAGRQAPLQAGRKAKRAPFKLGPTGMPAVALLWKNLIGAGAGFTLRMWLVTLWIATVTGITMTTSQRTTGIAGIGAVMVLMFLAMSFFMGPQLVRQDFRQDLPMADLLKSYPVPSWQLALGELLAPAVILTALQWCLIILDALLWQGNGLTDFTRTMRIPAAVAVAVMAPALNVLTLLIPNAAVLLFPGWFQTGRDAPQGIEATGQRLVFAIGQLVVLILALLPAAAVFAVIWLAASALSIGPTLVLPAGAVGAALVVAAEGAGGIFLLGRLFDRLDVSSEATPA
jgi:ABC-2 type transport system permease protein